MTKVIKVTNCSNCIFKDGQLNYANCLFPSPKEKYKIDSYVKKLQVTKLVSFKRRIFNN